MSLFINGVVMTSAAFIPYVTGEVSYTPLVIQFLPSVLHADGSPLENAESYYLLIKTPVSNHRGHAATLPETIRVDIPEDGLVRLQLVPNQSRLPINRYEVEYRRKGAKTPLLTQQWVVPEFTSYRRGSYVFISSGTLNETLPLDVWKVNDISAGTNWIATYNNLVWANFNSIPPVGERVTVDYEQALTLADVVE